MSHQWVNGREQVKSTLLFLILNDDKNDSCVLTKGCIKKEQKKSMDYLLLLGILHANLLENL